MRRVLIGTTIALASAFVLVHPVAVSTQDVTTSTSADKLIKFWAKEYPIPDAWKNLLSTYTYKVLAKAKPDECYAGLNYAATNLQSFNASYPRNLSKADIKSCLDAGLRLKINQSYIWGMTTSGNNIWFGTAANNVCRAPTSLLGQPIT